jgi:hypothetical protein
MKRLVFMLMVVLVVGTSANALTLVEDFEDYTTGAFRTDGSGTDAISDWSAFDNSTNPLSTGLVAIEDDGATQYAGFGWGNSGKTRGISGDVPAIVEGATATYYFQIRTEDETPNASFGLSDVESPTWFSDFEVQVALVYSSENGIQLGARNGESTEYGVSGLSADTWYDIWIVVDNATDTFDLYYGTSGDPDTMGTQIADDYAFRNGTTSDLGTFMAIGYGHEDLNAHIDDIYTSVPEPATMAILGLGALLICRKR